MRRQQPGSVIFLTELLLSLTIFALCSSVCASLFALSNQYSERSGELSKAVVAVQSCAEAFKKYPDQSELADILRGSVEGDDCVVYYDKDWIGTNPFNARYQARLSFREEAGLRLARITVSRVGGAEVYSVNASALVPEGGV